MIARQADDEQVEDAHHRLASKVMHTAEVIRSGPINRRQNCAVG